MSNIYEKNGFPRKLVQGKIKSLKERNFQPARQKSDRIDNFNTTYDNRLNLVLQYTSHRCESVAKKLLKVIKRLTPNFRLNFCWRTIKTSSICSPRLKESVPLYDRNGCIYKFTCAEKCQKSYVGETKRLLKTRIGEHFQEKRNEENPSAIYSHTKSCEHFQNEMTKKLAENPTASPAELSKLSREHIQSYFRPLAFSLNYEKRTTIEALMISLHEPELNEQVVHKKTFLV